MRRKLDVAEIYRRALMQIEETEIDGLRAGPVRPACPVTLDELLDEALRGADLIARFD